jgi:hypothetical protein
MYMAVFWVVVLCSLRKRGELSTPCKKFSEFNTIMSIHAGPEDIPVSFDAILLFTKVSTGQALCLLQSH